MNQRITVKIAEHEYQIVARSTEEEANIRAAAADVDKKLKGYISKFPGKSLVDLLSFVALNAGLECLAYQKELDKAKAEADGVKRGLESYLETI